MREAVACGSAIGEWSVVGERPHFLASDHQTVRFEGQRISVVEVFFGRSGGFAAVDGGFGAPLVAEEGEGLEDGLGEAEEVDEDGVV